MDFEGKYARLMMQHGDLYDGLSVWVPVESKERWAVSGQVHGADGVGIWRRPDSVLNNAAEEVGVWPGFKSEPKVAVLFPWHKIISIHLYDAVAPEKPPFGIRPS
jgi:hypothetical protein